LFAQFEGLIQRARELGLEIRYEHLDGRGGGICEFSGKRWLFVDLSISIEESWEQLHEAIQRIDASDTYRVPDSILGNGPFESIRKVG
jgi:hypothetical protein